MQGSREKVIFISSQGNTTYQNDN